MRSAAVLVAACLSFAAPAVSEPITVAAWNIEDYDFGGADPNSGSDGAVIATQLRDDFNGIDVFALSEISSEDVLAVLAAIAGQDEPGDYLYVFGQTGGSIHVGLLVNDDRFEILEIEELDFGLSPSGTRFPLAAKLKSRASGLEFMVVANHFARGNAASRVKQADALRDWSAAQNIPVIAAGDFNLDYNIVTEDRHEAFDRLVRNDALKWVRPDTLVDTSWSGGDTDSFPDEILDFVFVSTPGQNWESSSLVYVRPGDFPDKGDTADHRPVVAFFETEGIDSQLPDVHGSLSSLMPPVPADTAAALNGGKPRITSIKTEAALASRPMQSDLAGGAARGLSQPEGLRTTFGMGQGTFIVIDPDDLGGIPEWLWPVITPVILEGGRNFGDGRADGDNGR